VDDFSNYSVVDGVTASFKEMGIDTPTTASEMMAMNLAEQLDNGVDEKNLAGINRELRLTMDEIKANHPGNYDDAVDRLANRN
jgi:hypothetical protein